MEKNVFFSQKYPKYGLVSEKQEKNLVNLFRKRGVNQKLTNVNFFALFLKEKASLMKS